MLNFSNYFPELCCFLKTFWLHLFQEKVTGSGDRYEKSVAYKARRFGDSMLFTNRSRGAKYYVDLEAQLNITTSQNSVTEFKSTIDITWNNIRQKKNNLRQKNEVDEQALTYEFLQPYYEGNCDQHYNCLGCLSDNACGWCIETTSCVLRDDNDTEISNNKFTDNEIKDKCKGDMAHHLLITNVAECPICSDYVSCSDCSAVSSEAFYRVLFFKSPYLSIYKLLNVFVPYFSLEICVYVPVYFFITKIVVFSIALLIRPL